MKQFFIKLINFILSLFHKKKEKEIIVEPIEYSYLPQLTIENIKVERNNKETFHLTIYFPIEEKDDIEKIVININGDKDETGYI